MTPVYYADCLTAQLQFLGKIQGHGALLVADDNDTIVAASSNCEAWLGHTANEFLGHPWMAVFPEIHPPSTLQSFEELGLSGIHLHPVVLNGQALVMARHRSGEHVVIEFEPVSETDALGKDRGAILAALLKQMAQAKTKPEATQCLMRFIAMVTGFDRVMVLQFMPDGHGVVIDEQLKPGVPGYLNQHFPASDIPENARALYLKKLQRFIANAHTDPVDILSTQPQPVDLTWSELRAVHPVHTQYMRNMGTASSFSVSIVVGGHLWGLITCHNIEPRSLSFAERQLCEHLASVTGLHMTGLSHLRQANERHTHLISRRQFRQDIQMNGISDQTLHRQLGQLYKTFKADGVWLHYQAEDHTVGAVPDIAGRMQLMAWMNRSSPRHPILALNRLPGALGDDDELRRLASGILHIPLNETDSLTLFRKEQSEKIRWAGMPQSVASPKDPNAELTPRSSFDIWQQESKGIALAWSEVEVESAIRLRTSLQEAFEYLELEHQSQTDALTGLANRNQLNRILQHLIKTDRSSDKRSAVLMIDLDHFKPVNDKYGHAAGDYVLKAIALRMQDLLRENDTLARLGGDEFAVVMPHIRAASDTERLGRRLLEAIHQPCTLENGATVTLTGSIGAAIWPNHGNSPQSLLHSADLAMYAVKRASRSGFRLYDPDMTLTDMKLTATDGAG